ncbi:MAG: AAA family ATPase [Aquihabitans sp.]
MTDALGSTDLGSPATASISALVEQVSAVVLGDPGSIWMAAAAFTAGGHVLFEDIPGVGKTLLAKALAASIGGTFGRIQGTPDLLPSDLTGVTVYDDDTRTWNFRPGPLFNHVVLVDELNRATPRTQSALLEAMAEGQVTVDGTTHRLPDPFFVVATQNPHGGDIGTFPLVAGQRDRFSVSLSLGLPGRDAELQVLSGSGGDHALAGLTPVADLATWRHIRNDLEEVFVHPRVAVYVLDIVDAVRTQTSSSQPLSTRASLSLLRLARARALSSGRSYVEPDDVQAVAVPGLSHRILDATNDDLPTARAWIANFASTVPAPPIQGS